MRRAFAVAVALAACDAAPRADRRAAADALVEAVRSLRASPRTRPAAIDAPLPGDAVAAFDTARRGLATCRPAPDPTEPAARMPFLLAWGQRGCATLPSGLLAERDACRSAARAVLAAGRHAEPPTHRLVDLQSIVDEMASGANTPVATLYEGVAEVRRLVEEARHAEAVEGCLALLGLVRDLSWRSAEWRHFAGIAVLPGVDACAAALDVADAATKARALEALALVAEGFPPDALTRAQAAVGAAVDIAGGARLLDERDLAKLAPEDRAWLASHRGGDHPPPNPADVLATMARARAGQYLGAEQAQDAATALDLLRVALAAEVERERTGRWPSLPEAMALARVGVPGDVPDGRLSVVAEEGRFGVRVIGPVAFNARFDCQAGTHVVKVAEDDFGRLEVWMTDPSDAAVAAGSDVLYACRPSPDEIRARLEGEARWLEGIRPSLGESAATLAASPPGTAPGWARVGGWLRAAGFEPGPYRWQDETGFVRRAGDATLRVGLDRRDLDEEGEYTVVQLSLFRSDRPEEPVCALSLPQLVTAEERQRAQAMLDAVLDRRPWSPIALAHVAQQAEARAAGRAPWGIPRELVVPAELDRAQVLAELRAGRLPPGVRIRESLSGPMPAGFHGLDDADAERWTRFVVETLSAATGRLIDACLAENAGERAALPW